MPWTRKFLPPIHLTDGRSIVTLADARGVILSLPTHRQRNEEWLYAMGLVREAAVLNGPMAATEVQMRRALRLERLI